MVTLTRWTGRILLILAGIAMVLGYGMIGWRDGLAALAEILSPWNLANWLMVVGALAPGLGLLKLAQWLEARRAARRAP